MVCPLTLVWGKSSNITASNISSVFFSLFPPITPFSLCVFYTFCSHLTFLRYGFFFLSSIFFLFAFLVWSVLLKYPQAQRFFFSVLIGVEGKTWGLISVRQVFYHRAHLQPPLGIIYSTVSSPLGAHQRQSLLLEQESQYCLMEDILPL
jgi:hypothetical protein